MLTPLPGGGDRDSQGFISLTNCCRGRRVLRHHLIASLSIHFRLLARRMRTTSTMDLPLDLSWLQVPTLVEVSPWAASIQLLLLALTFPVPSLACSIPSFTRSSTKCAITVATPLQF